MIYFVAFFLPPIALLAEGKPFSAIFNLAIVVLGILLAILPGIGIGILLVASAHAILVISESRRRREHREMVDAAREGRLHYD